ncbi:MAG: hypothetical protein QOE35_1332 [Actinomycetota bacterium]|jgi:uncharacterized RmlC-like cupin family protein
MAAARTLRGVGPYLPPRPVGETGKDDPVATHRPPEAWHREDGQVDAMQRAIAVSAATVGSEGIYTSVVTTAPGGRTRLHHHGPCETSIYVIAGSARFTWGPTGAEHAFEAGPGDVVYIPALEPHVEENPSATEDLVVLVSRNCAEGINHYLD